MPTVIMEAAQSNIKKDFLRRWWCKRYDLPPTDPRLLAYTVEELFVEFLEHAIDNDLIVLGKDGKPAVYEETKDGSDVLKTGFDLFDDEEERWSSQKTIEELIAEHQGVIVTEDDILEQIKAEVDSNAERPSKR